MTLTLGGVQTQLDIALRLRHEPLFTTLRQPLTAAAPLMR
jgi:hypothetical protein